MRKGPQIWHYGLMAERWAEFLDEAPELDFFRWAISRYGEPALDLACGTGRLLLPLLADGIDIDGCDVSGDMLAHCRRKAQAEGLSTDLFQQPMDALDLPRHYRTIYICDSLGLTGSRQKDLNTLHPCHAHLKQGGALILNIQAEYTSPESWTLWLEEKRNQLPEPWPEHVAPRVARDGSDHYGYFRYLELDPLEQTYTRAVRLEKWLAGEKIASEEYTLRGNIYLKNEVVLMLKVAGFDQIAVTGEYSNQPATPESEELVFAAVK